jgi:amino acid transporter
MQFHIRRLLIGKPLHNDELEREQLPKWKALSIFSSDALSSVAYGPEQIMLTLVGASGMLLYGYMVPVALAIFILLGMVTLSYVQVARANPEGGGAYAVAKKNLGVMPSLVVAGAIFADYVLTAAVSVSAGTDAIVSAFPVLYGHEVSIDIFVLLVVLMLINMRGVSESADFFVLPTYAFLFGIICLVIVGVYDAFFFTQEMIPTVSAQKQPLDWAVLFLVLRAFANGCSSMTGVEAIAGSVPMFKAPSARNAVATTYWMAGLLGFMFLGISFLIIHYHIMPASGNTALAQLVENVFGRGAVFYYIQITTMLVLYLAANTAYNGLPVLMSIIAQDGYMPRYLATRGERLTYSNGIILLTLAAAVLLIIFDGNIEHLISLYAIGVFISFTIAQASMVVHWYRERGRSWHIRALLNGLGALTTGVVVTIITITKFIYGAWAIIIFIPAMIFVFKAIRSHYDDVAKQLQMPLGPCRPRDVILSVRARHQVIVPVSSPTRVVYETIRYAKSISDNVVAVNICPDEETGRKVRQKWEEWNPDVELVTIYSPYRLLRHPLMEFINQRVHSVHPEDYVTVLIPEFEPKKWWQRFLHNQSGWLLRTNLILSKKHIIVATVPFHLH